MSTLRQLVGQARALANDHPCMAHGHAWKSIGGRACPHPDEVGSGVNTQCNWSQDGEDSDVWQTQCGHYMTIIEGTPAENEFAHCCFCGKSLVGHPFEAND